MMKPNDMFASGPMTPAQRTALVREAKADRLAFEAAEAHRAERPNEFSALATDAIAIIGQDRFAELLSRYLRGSAAAALRGLEGGSL